MRRYQIMKIKSRKILIPDLEWNNAQVCLVNTWCEVVSVNQQRLLSQINVKMKITDPVAIQVFYRELQQLHRDPHDLQAPWYAQATSQTLYWIDAAGFRIESSAVDGSNRQTVTSVNVNINPWGIVYYSGNLYWTDRNSNRSLIYTSSARFPSPRNLLSGFTLNFFPLGIEVVSSSRQLQGKLLLLRVRQSGGAWFGSCCHTY